MLCCFDENAYPNYGKLENPQRQYQQTPTDVMGSIAGMGTSTTNPNLMEVTVPPGGYQGQTLLLSVPDGRVVPIVVPRGMSPGSEFLVQIPPAPSTFFKPATPSIVYATEIQSSSQMSDQASVPTTGLAPNAKAVDQQRLLRVPVPPGTPAGTIVNVQVPEEPWRFIQVEVPPNVSDFEVPYYSNENKYSMKAETKYEDNEEAASSGSDRKRDATNIQEQQPQGGDRGMEQYIMPTLVGVELSTVAAGMFHKLEENGNDGKDDVDGGYAGVDDDW